MIEHCRTALALCLILFVHPVVAGEAAQHLAAAVRFPTVSHQDPDQFNAAAFRDLHRFLRATYPRVFAELEVEVVNEFSLLITWQGAASSAKPVLFTAHMDVVPVEPGTEADWTHPAFAGVIDNGVIYGRGTLDDKVGVISLLEAAERLLEQGWQPRRTLVFGFGHDEEIGGEAGAAAIAARLRERGLHFEWMVDEGSYIFDGNPLLPGKKTVAIGVAEKSYLTLIFSVEGEGGHSSMPPAQTTIGRLADAVLRVEQNPFPTRLGPPVDTMLERSAPYQEFPQNLIFSNLWLTGGLIADRMVQEQTTAGMVRTTTALTMFNAGVKENVIPQSAEARINFRLLPGDTADEVIARVRELVDDPGVEISVAREWRPGPPIAAMAGGGYDIIGRAAQSVYPEGVVLPFMLPATTDIRHYIELADNHYRFHGAAIGLSQASGAHGTDEWLAVDSLERAVDIAEQMMRGTD